MGILRLFKTSIMMIIISIWGGWEAIKSAFLVLYADVPLADALTEVFQDMIVMSYDIYQGLRATVSLLCRISPIIDFILLVIACYVTYVFIKSILQIAMYIISFILFLVILYVLYFLTANVFHWEYISISEIISNGKNFIHTAPK